MILPPLSMWLHVAPNDHRAVRLWLPLFLIWLVLLPLVLLVFVLAMIADVFLWLAGRPYHHYALLLFRCLGALAATRGTVVRIHADDTVVDVTIH